MWETRLSNVDRVLFQDSDFAGDLEDSKSKSGGVLCIFGSHTFLPISWMCMKQTSVSHSSTESEVISLDAGMRMDGILALDLWDVVIDRSVTFIEENLITTHQAAGNCSQNHKSKPKQRGETVMLINCRKWTTSPQMQILLKSGLSCSCLKAMK